VAAVGYYLSVVGGWWLAASGWLLSVSGWRLVVGGWWLAVAVAARQWFPGRPPSLRSGGWGVALRRAAAVLLPSRVRFPRSWWLASLAPCRLPRVPRCLRRLRCHRVVIASGLPSFCFPLLYYATFTWLCQHICRVYMA
jgi:hypothetical protein